MRELPEGWVETTLSEIAEVVDCEHKTAPKVEQSEYYSIRTTDIKGGKIDLSIANKVSFETYSKWIRRATPESGDIILAREAPVGEVGWIKEGCNVCLGQRTVLLKVTSNEVYKKYLLYHLTRPSIKYELRVRATGSVVSHLNMKDIRAFQLSLPPLPKQKAIADMLSSFDEKIELLREQNKTLGTLAQTIFKEWFVSFNYPDLSACGHAQADATGDMVESELGEIPQGWRVGSLLEVFDLIGGGTPKTSVDEYWNGDTLWYSVVDAPKGSDTFVIDTEKKISDLGLQKSSTKLLRKGTTIVSARGTVGKLALVGCETAMNQSCYGIQGKGCFGDCYVYFQLKEALNSLKSRVHGAVFDTITQATFKHIEVHIPDMDVAESFEKIVKPTMDKVLNNVFQIKTLSKTRDTLLPKLMRGQVRVKA